MERTSPSHKLTIGDSLPNFELPSVDGRSIGTSYFQGAKAVVVAFTCNHCPYVKGSEEELISLVRRFQGQGLRAVAINSNDPVKYPEDNFEEMKKKAIAMDLPYPYLFDASQGVARAFDAECTPEIYLFDDQLKLVYHGTINDSPRDSSKVTKHFLTDAIEAVLQGSKPTQAFVHPLGCSIKWK